MLIEGTHLICRSRLSTLSISFVCMLAFAIHYCGGGGLVMVDTIILSNTIDYTEDVATVYCIYVTVYGI